MARTRESEGEEEIVRAHVVPAAARNLGDSMYSVMMTTACPSSPTHRKSGELIELVVFI